MVARRVLGVAAMRYWLILGAALAVAAPALADVKAGVDAWSAGDFRKAVSEWRGPAVAGDADAQFNLGQAYKLGRGVPVDPALAESWFRKAALQGHVQAQDNYGLALFQSDRKAEALPWLEKSVARGEPRAQLVLGTMLFNGDGGVARDYPRAYALLSRAAAAGLPSATQTLAQMDAYITPADRERGTALAQTYALQAIYRPAPGAMQVADTPTRAVEPIAVVTPTPTPAPTPTPTPTSVAIKSGKPLKAPRPAPRPDAQPAKVATAAPPVAAQTTPRSATTASIAARGGWKAQLGAFRDRANAEALWAKVRGRLGGATPAYVVAGGITRLQATGFASKAEAQRACGAAGVACVVVAP